VANALEFSVIRSNCSSVLRYQLYFMSLLIKVAECFGRPIRMSLLMIDVDYRMSSIEEVKIQHLSVKQLAVIVQVDIEHS